MNRFKRLPLVYRIILPIAAAAAVGGAVNLVTVATSLDGLQDRADEDTAALQERLVAERFVAFSAQYEGLLDQLGSSGLRLAATFSGHAVVDEAYELALAGDLSDENCPFGQQAREILREKMSGQLDAYKGASGETLKLHFHLPNGRSLARTWRKGWQTKRDGEKLDISDDVSRFRPSVVAVNRDRQALKGVEIGRDGLVVRGLVPVRSSAGAHLGSAEVMFSFAEVIAQLCKDEDQQCAAFLHADQLKVASKLADPQANPRVDGRFVLVTATDRARILGQANGQLLDAGMKGFSMERHGHDRVAVFPIKDLSGASVGVLLSSLDLAEDGRAMAEMHDRQDTLMGEILLLLLLVLAIAVGVVVAVTLVVARKTQGLLTGIISGLRENSSGVACASGRIAAASHQSVEGAVSQASALTQASANLEQLASSPSRDVATVTRFTAPPTAAAAAIGRIMR